MNIILSSFLMITAMILLFLGIVGIRHRDISGARAFSLLIAAMAIHSAGYGFELISTTQEEMYFWIRIEYLAMSFYPLLILWFAREYAGERKFANQILLFFVLGLNVLTLVFVQTNPLHGWYYAALGIDMRLGFPVLVTDKGFWYIVQVIVTYFAIGYALVVFSMQILKTRGASRKRVVLILIGMLIPLVTSILYLTGIGPSQIDLSAFSYLFISIFAACGLYRYDILFLSEITHEMIFNTIEEAVIVVDEEGFILNHNQTTEALFIALGELTVGDNVNKYPVLGHILVGKMTQLVTIGKQHYQVRLISIGKQLGTIIVFNDVTEITNTKKQLEILATTDQLTKLYNRRYFVDCFERLKRDGVVMLLDIDRFKNVNDKYGHPAGDEVLSELAQCLKDHFPDGVIYRYGGEEFAVLIEGKTVEMAKERADLFRESFEKRETEIPCTVSIGLCHYEKGNYSSTMNLVDKLLYQAKNAGKNCVVAE